MLFRSAPEGADKSKMELWAKVLGTIGVVMIVASLIVTILGQTMHPTEGVIFYLNDIGFQAFIFFGVLVGCNAVWLWSNAHDDKEDPKALPINLNLFATTRSYTIGSIGICAITMLLYILLW